MRVQLSDPSYLQDLILALRHGDCLATPTGLDTLVVVHPWARDDEEARTELLFFLRAWQASHPHTGVELA
jgi:hypothetical protein